MSKHLGGIIIISSCRRQKKRRILSNFRVEYPGTWLQRLSPADVSTAELARRCSRGMNTLLVDDVECALAANKDL